MRVAIIAGGDSRHLVPYDDTSILKWGLNDYYSIMPFDKFDRWFELHSEMDLKMCRFENLSHLDGLKRLNIPIYMCAVSPQLETSIQYPIEMVSKMFRGYFENTICYMIALAICEGATEIHLYGVDMLKSTYQQLKLFMCLMYWVGVAEGRGIKVIIPEASRLYMHDVFYGGFYETD